MNNIQIEDKELMLKLFFRLLDKFLENEIKVKGIENLKLVLKGSNFVKSLFCLSLEFHTYIRDDNKFNL